LRSLYLYWETSKIKPLSRRRKEKMFLSEKRTHPLNPLLTANPLAIKYFPSNK